MAFVTRQLKTAARQRRPPADWTMLIYQASDNNLSEDCMYALSEMNKVVHARKTPPRGAKAAPPKLSVVAQLDPVGRGNPTLRFEITKQASGLEKKVIKTFVQETDESRADTLIQFLSESISDFPAEHYIVVLNGHGAGFLNGFFLRDDDRPSSSVPSALRIRLLTEVFGSKRVVQALKGKKIDILGFDSCMMSTIEVCFQLLPTAANSIAIGSEGFALNSGWPYERIVTKLQNERVEPEDLAKSIVDEHISFYSDYELGGLSVDISAIRLNKIRTLKSKIDDLAAALKAVLKRDEYVERGERFQDAILLSHWATQSYNGEQCVDLYDFCNLLQKRLPKNAKGKQISRLCQKVQAAIIGNGQNSAVIRGRSAGAAFQFSNGISIYFPWARFDIAPEYRDLGFVKAHSKKRKASPWLKFLERYLQATQRRSKFPPPEDDRVEFRSTPPYTKGPDGIVHSMRNPPMGIVLKI
jgi:hypothetical protein